LLDLTFAKQSAMLRVNKSVFNSINRSKICIVWTNWSDKEHPK